MGTRMVSAAESPVHDNWKQAIVDAAETDTVFLNQHTSPGAAGPAHRAHDGPRVRPRDERHGRSMANPADLYFGGDMEAAIALSGQVAGRIDAVRPVAEIIARLPVTAWCWPTWPSATRAWSGRRRWSASTATRRRSRR